MPHVVLGVGIYIRLIPMDQLIPRYLPHPPDVSDLGVPSGHSLYVQWTEKCVNKNLIWFHGFSIHTLKALLLL
jgi:hypothetical protein